MLTGGTAQPRICGKALQCSRCRSDILGRNDKTVRPTADEISRGADSV
jgi:ferredoxin